MESKEIRQKMEASIEHFNEELRNIRTGRANPGMVEGVQVDVYGTQMQLRDIASVSTPEPRQLLINPFDANNSDAIGKAIEKANLGMLPIVEANCVRLNIPPMDEAMRKDMVKLVNKRKEECKVSIRNVRRESNDTIRRLKTDGDITEDQMHRQEKEIQEMTDQFCKRVDEIAAAKESEVMSV